MKKVLMCVIDGCSPDYISRETAPELFQIVDECGFYKIIQGAVPTVTNVNHACILTGKTPEETGIIGNYYYNREICEEGFIEEKSFLKAETLFDKFYEAGQSSAIIAVKHKVIGVYGEHASITISAEKPVEDVLKKIGLPSPPSINDEKCTKWVMNAAFECIRKQSPDFIYCTTNDYIFHHYAPGTPEAKRQISFIDEYISAIHKLESDRQIFILADHGMNQKHKLLDFRKTAEKNGIELFALPPLKDRYIANHRFQEGGVLFLFLKNPAKAEDLIELAEKTEEVEKILTAREAAEQYSLPEDSIGDYVLFAAKDCAFAELESERMNTNDSRTHGSLYEREIPFIAINVKAEQERFKYSWDIKNAIIDF